jgi:RHS repeat-associated protein
VVATTDSTTAATANTYTYDPYGGNERSTGSAPNVWGFTGGYQMPGGFYHFGARYYDPTFHRFTQQDPVDQAGDLLEGNRYIYAADDPINNTDPTGEYYTSGCRYPSNTVQRGAGGTPGESPCSPPGAYYRRHHFPITTGEAACSVAGTAVGVYTRSAGYGLALGLACSAVSD